MASSRRLANLPKSTKYVLMLGSMSTMGAISFDMYLPSLPKIAHDLHTTASNAQLTMTTMLIGAAIGQLVVGPLSDRMGRRRPAMIGTACHVIISLGCAVMWAIVPLIALRTLQGFCNAAAGVVGMAVLRDRFIGQEAARIMSRNMLVIGVSPLFAPSVGGFIARWFTWRGVFVVLAMYGIGLLLVMWKKLPETLPTAHRNARLVDSYRGFAAVIRDGKFDVLPLLPGFHQALLMSYVVGSPFVFQGQYHLSPGQFSLVFATNGVGLVAAAQVNAAIVKRVPSAKILRVSLPLFCVASGLLLFFGATGIGGLPLMLIFLFCSVGLVTIGTPNAAALAMARHGDNAGSAAACLGVVQNLMPGIISPLVGMLGEDSAAMGAVMFSCAVAAFLVAALGAGLFFRGGAERLDAIAAGPVR